MRRQKKQVGGQEERGAGGRTKAELRRVQSKKREGFVSNLSSLSN